MKNDNYSEFSLPESLLWLMDAPLFMDDELIDRYYDAIVRPVHTNEGRVIHISEESVGTISAKLGLSGKVSPGDLLGKLLSQMLDVELAGEATVEGSKTKTQLHEGTIQLKNVNTPHRRLEQLALHYVVNYTDRIYLESDTKGKKWRDPADILRTPRSLAFFNLPSQDEATQLGLPGTRLIPTAAEFENGEVVPIYENLQFGRWIPPEYPYLDSKSGSSSEQTRESRKTYWKDFAENYQAADAMRAVEKASIGRGRISWIDFRVPLSDDGESLHLHFHAAGKYDTGTFAYNFIKRGNRHGLRIVGTLKSEPDLNVICVYEK